MAFFDYPQHIDKSFSLTFKTSLRRFWSPLYGFDVIAFDDKFVKAPDGVSAEEQIRKDYGNIGVRIIKQIIHLEMKKFK